MLVFYVQLRGQKVACFAVLNANATYHYKSGGSESRVPEM